MSSLFPDTEKSRNGHKTEALPVIWSEWEKFSTMIDEFVSVSEKLQQVASTTADEKELKSAFFEAAKNCKSCHKRYRKPKK